MFPALEQLLTELDDFLKVLDQETLSSAAMVKKGGLAELLRIYTKSNGKCGRGLGRQMALLRLSAQLLWAFTARSIFSHLRRPAT